MTIKTDLMNTDYVEEDNKPCLWWFLRDVEGKRVKRKFSWVKPHAWNNDPSSGPATKDIFGRTVYEWTTRMPSEIGGGRDRYSMTCEADVLFPMRAMIDLDVYCGVEIAEDNSIKAVENHGIPPVYSLFDFEYFSPKEIMPMPGDPKWPAVTVQWGLTSDNIIHVIVLNFVSQTQAPAGILTEKLIAESIIRKFIWENFKSITVHIELKDEKTGKWLIEPQDLTYPVEVTIVEDERDLFIKFAEWHESADVDGWAGYNSNNYDWPMYFRRADRLGISWLVAQHISPLHRASARFNQQYKKWDVHIWGQTITDLNEIYKKYIKPSGERTSYDFKIVVKDECGFAYDDLGAFIKTTYENDPQALIEYAAKDVIALKLLNEKCDLLPYIDVLRRVAGTPFDKATSNKALIDTMCLRLADAPLPTGIKHLKTKKATGALVIMPEVGLHEWVILLDLKSIYPTMIIAYNLSPECKDPNGEIQIPIVDAFGRIVEYVGFRKSPQGVLPKVAAHMMVLREHYRTLGREIESQANFDKQYRERIKSQETVAKFLACAINGVLAYPGFRLYDPEVFNCVTSITRSVIWKIRGFLEPKGFKTMYGDSVSADSPVLIKRDNEIDILPISELAPTAEGRYALDNIEVWTRNGFKQGHYVKVSNPHKTMYRVNTIDGIVDVTEDHSLFDLEGKEVKPTELPKRIETVVYPIRLGQTEISEDEAWLLGLICAEGSLIGNNEQPVISCDEDKLRWAKEILDGMGYESWLHDYTESSKCWRLCVSTKARGLFRECTTGLSGWKGRNKKVPKRILNSGKDAMIGFLRGLWAGDAPVDQGNYIDEFKRIDLRSQSLIVGVEYIMYQLGFVTSWRSAGSNKLSYGLRIGKTKKIASGVVREVKEIQYKDLVYDIGTNDGTFAIGRVVAHNTDSIFIKLTATNKEDAARQGFEIETMVQEYITEWTRSLGATYPIDVKFEHLFDRILWKKRAKGDDPAKKHYGGHYIMKDGAWKEGLKISGLAPKSSASALFTRKLTSQFLELVLEKHDIDSAVMIVSQAWEGILLTKDVSTIGIPKGLHQVVADPEDAHGSTKPWIEGVFHAKKVFQWRFSEDDKPKLIYTVPTKEFPYKTLCLNVDQTTIPKGVRVDWNLQREKVIKNKFFELLEAIGRDWSEIEFKVRKTRMDQFFG